MYWLVFYNGVEVPEIEAGFSLPCYLCRFVERFIENFSTVSLYTVLCPDSTCISLMEFWTNYKEV